MGPHRPPAAIHFLGAAGTVTGSRFLVDSPSARILVDCGMFQGNRVLRERNWTPFPVDPASIDAVVITHAHLDHIGYLPVLAQQGFGGAVWCTSSTASLADIVLRDAAHLQEEEAEYANRKGYSRHHPAVPLYTAEDAELALRLIRSTPVRTTVALASGVDAVLRPAGHILGSTTVELRLETPDQRLLFTGDLGRPAHPLLAAPDDPPNADVVVTESTYGDRQHEDEAAALHELADVITRTAERGGMVIIPAFAVDRTEVVLLALARLAAEGRVPRLPIHADSPMALAVLEVYRKAIAIGEPEIRGDVEVDDFAGAGELHEVHTSEESKRLDELRYPSIIISASGMASGGRVLHHLAHRLPDRRNAVVFVGFQAPGTRGQTLVDGARTVRLFGADIPVRAEVHHLQAFSVHAGAGELAGWISRMPSPPRQIHVVHGEPGASHALAQRLSRPGGPVVSVPGHGDVTPLG